MVPAACRILSREINDNADLLRIRSPETFRQSGINVRTFHKVVLVDTEKKTVCTQNFQTGGMVEDYYDQLVVASGAQPVMPPFPGRTLRGINTLKSIQHILDFACSEAVKNVVIVGAGYIGLELADAFGKLHRDVRVIEAAARPMGAMDEEFSDIWARATLMGSIQSAMVKLPYIRGMVFIRS